MNTVVMIIMIYVGNSVDWHIVPYSSYAQCHKSLEYPMTISEQSMRWCMDSEYLYRK